MLIWVCNEYNFITRDFNKMASPEFVAIKSTSASRFLLILPVLGQKVKCVS